MGSELVDCGDFSCAVPLDYWSNTGTNTSVLDGNLVFNGNSANTWAIQSLFSAGLYNGKILKITYTISENTLVGSGNFRRGGYSGSSVFPSSSNLNTTVGTHTEYITVNSSGNNNALDLWITSGYTSGNLKISNISLKESTKNNLARVDYDGTASSLLVEPMRTNLIPYSEDFNSWLAKDYVTVAENTSETTSPSGNNTASKITINSVSTIRRLYEVVTTSSGSDYTFTLYAKKGTTDYIRFYLNSNMFDVSFDLTNGTKTVIAGSGSIESVGNDWYRLQATGTSSSTTEVPQIQLSNSASVSDYLYIWGAQLEEGSYPTSYIPTNGEAGGVTRVQDQYSKTGISNLINSEEGVLFVEMAALSDDLTNRGISLNDGTSSNRLLLYFNTTSNQIVVISTGFTGSISYTLPDETSFNKFAVRYKANDITLWVDGESRGTPIVSATIPTFTALKFDSGAGASPFYGKVKQLKIYDTYLSNGEMQTLTT